MTFPEIPWVSRGKKKWGKTPYICSVIHTTYLGLSPKIKGPSEYGGSTPGAVSFLPPEATQHASGPEGAFLGLERGERGLSSVEGIFLLTTSQAPLFALDSKLV